MIDTISGLSCVLLSPPMLIVSVSACNAWMAL